MDFLNYVVLKYQLDTILLNTPLLHLNQTLTNKNATITTYIVM